MDGGHVPAARHGRDAIPWYRDGLRFSCTRCGSCCTGASGAVRVSDEEVAVLARREGLTVYQFRAAYTRTLPGGDTSLRELRSGACVFWEAEAGCRVYAHRPRQCRTWPFWLAVVASPRRWAEEARHCPGMNRGRWHDPRWIDRTATCDGVDSGGAAPSAGSRFEPDALR